MRSDCQPRDFGALLLRRHDALGRALCTLYAVHGGDEGSGARHGGALGAAALGECLTVPAAACLGVAVRALNVVDIVSQKRQARNERKSRLGMTTVSSVKNWKKGKSLMMRELFFFFFFNF